jgi:hypothetical protein
MAVSAWRLRHFPGKPGVSDHFLQKRPRNPMGDIQDEALRVDFDRQIKLEFHGSIPSPKENRFGVMLNASVE